MCGIFSIINQQDEVFDYQTFCTLGVANDRRGGDSCGIFIDGQTEYGINDKKYFEDFFWTSDLLNNTGISKIALGHCRKASPGMAVNLQNAHPIVIEEDVQVAEGEAPRREVKFVLVHNGTLYNHEKLAKKYIPDVNVTGMTDSQIIARLIYYSGWDWLAEYNGGTAFIAVDYREGEPKTYIWRGESKKTSVDKEAEEERPLYCNYENNRLVVSSIGTLLAICDGNCYLVPANKVITYENGRLKVVKVIDRSKAQQNRIYDASAYTPHNTSYNSNIAVYITHVDKSNLFRADGNLVDGGRRISQYGKIITKFDNPTYYENQHTIFFFNGIALIEMKAYTFLSKAWKRSRMPLKEFTEKYQNFIRFFSYDKCYYVEDKMYKASSPWKCELFSGTYFPLGQARSYRYLNGIDTNAYIINTAEESFNCFKEVPNIDYKTIWKEFIQSIA